MSHYLLLLLAAITADPFAVTVAEPSRVTVSETPLLASVKVAVRDGDVTYHGSGTILESQPGRSIILTCWHTYRGTSAKAVTTVEHASRSYTARVLRADAASDVTLLEIDTEHALPVARLADVVPSIGETVHSCGRDANGTLTVSRERLTAIDRYDAPLNLETDGIANQGRSGGGLFNAAGQLVGVLQGQRTDTRAVLYVRLPPIRKLISRDVAAATTDKPARSRRVLAFTAKWCGPCNARQSFLNEAAPWLKASGWQIDESERAHIQIVDIDERPDLAKRYGIETIPAFVLIENGEAKSRDVYRGRMTVVEMLAGASNTNQSLATQPAQQPVQQTIQWYYPQQQQQMRRRNR